jgi:hypothetical protein
VLRIAVAAVLIAHGVIHLIGFVVPWQLATLDDFPYRTSALDGAIVLGDVGARLVGVVWLALAVGFVIAGVGVARGSSWTVPLLAVISTASLVVCVLGLPEAFAGIVVNLAILVLIGLRAVLGPASGSGHLARRSATR